MRFKILAVLTVCTLLTTMTLAQATPTTNTQVLGKGSVISFDFPGATNTQATGITPSGDIVGQIHQSGWGPARIPPEWRQVPLHQLSWRHFNRC